MKLIRLCNSLMKLGFSIFAIYMIFMKIQIGDTDRILVTSSLLLVVLVPWLVRRILHYDLSDILEFIYLIFIFLAQLLGSIVNLYASVWWWDLFTHGLSGVFTSIVALLVLKKFGLLKRKGIWFTVIFMICFSLSVASCWEFCEFLMDKISGGDTQWVLKTGVDDTMTDMLVAFLGSILFSLYYLFSVFTNRRKVLEQIEEIL